MHSYDNGTSLPSRQGNWSQLQRVIFIMLKSKKGHCKFYRRYSIEGYSKEQHLAN